MGDLLRTGDGRVLAENREGRLHLRKERSDGWTAEHRATFLDTLAATCNVDMSAKAAGRNAQSVQALRRRDSEFATAWDHALETGYATLEAMLLARAQQVLAQPVALATGAFGTEDDESSKAEHAPVAATVTDMTTHDAMRLLDRYRKTVNGVRSGVHGERDGRAATAKETYMAIIDRMRVLKIRMGEGE